MMNEKSMVTVPIGAGVRMFDDFFGREVELETLVRNSYWVMKLSGSFVMQTREEEFEIRNHQVELPCPAYEIEWVTGLRKLDPLMRVGDPFMPQSGILRVGHISDPYNFLPGNLSEGTLVEYPVTDAVDVQIAPMVADKRLPSRPAGQYLDYDVDEEKLNFAFTDVKVRIKYNTIKLNGNKHPELKEYTLYALVHYQNFLDMQKLYFKRQIDLNTFTKAEQLKDAAMKKAKSGNGLSDNAMNRLLDIWTSHNRKTFGVDFNVMPR